MSTQNLVDRHHDSFLAAPERRLLIAIATRLPPWVTPDGLTAFGVLGGVLVLVGFVFSNTSGLWLWLANLGLVVNWFGDSLDGTVARVRKIERPRYGFFLDQNIDVITNLFIALGAGFSPWLRLDTALLVLTGYHMLSMHTFIKSVVTRKMQVDVRGLGPTEMRLTIFGMNIFIIFLGAAPHSIWGIEGTIWDLLAVLLSVGMAFLFVLELAVDAVRLRRENN